MKEHHYPFARIFIRIAIGLAVFSLLAGGWFVIMNFGMMRAEIRGLQYQPSPELLEQASRLERLYFGTRGRIAQTMEDNELPASLAVVDFTSSIEAAKRAKGTGQPEMLLSLADEADASIQQLKEYHVGSFDRAIESLRQALLQRVKDLQAQFGQTAPSSISSTTDTQPVQPGANEPSPTPKFRIYSDPDDRMRMQSLESVRSFLNNLREQSQREESLDQIRRAQIYLTRAEAMLDQLQTVVEQSRADAGFAPQTEQTAQQHMVSRAEQLAGELEHIRRLIRQSLYESWQVDDAITAMRISARSDLAAAQNAQMQIQSIQARSFSQMGGTFLAAIAVAFLILVLADFLSAFLNLSVNSDHFVMNARVAPPPAIDQPAPAPGDPS